MICLVGLLFVASNGLQSEGWQKSFSVFDAEAKRNANESVQDAAGGENHLVETRGSRPGDPTGRGGRWYPKGDRWKNWQRPTVTCIFKLDKYTTRVYWMGQDISGYVVPNISEPGYPKSFTVWEEAGAVLAISGYNDQKVRGSRGNCKSAALILRCSSTYPESEWNGWVASTSSMRSKAHFEPEEQFPTDWYQQNYDDSNWEKPCESTSGWNMDSLYPTDPPPKIWGADRFSYFRSQAKVTCYIKLDKHFTLVYYNDHDIKESVVPEISTTIYPKSFSFYEVSGAVLAIGGYNDENVRGSYSNCKSAGLMLRCSSTNPASGWNGWEASTSSMRSRAHYDPESEIPTEWFKRNYDDSDWEKPCESTTNWNMEDVYPEDPPPKIWGADRVSLFRSIGF